MDTQKPISAKPNMVGLNFSGAYKILRLIMGWHGAMVQEISSISVLVQEINQSKLRPYTHIKIMPHACV